MNETQQKFVLTFGVLLFLLGIILGIIVGKERTLTQHEKKMAEHGSGGWNRTNGNFEYYNFNTNK